MSTRVLAVVLALGIVLLGVIRSAVTGQGVIGGHKTRIDFWNGFTGPDGRIMLGLIRKFNDANPDVEVTMQRMDWATYYNKLMVAALDGRGPEIYVIQSEAMPRMHRAGFVANLTGLFGDSPNIPRSDFDPLVLEQVTYGSELVGVPLDIWPFGLYSNADLLKKAGINHPPTNRKEFLADIQAIQTPMNGNGERDTWGYALTNWRQNFQTVLPQFDGYYFDKNGRAALDNPHNVEALSFFANLQNSKVLPPPDNAEGWVGYRQKKVAMVIDGIYMLGDLQRLEDFHYVGAPTPVIGNHPGTMADSHVLCIRNGIDPDRRAASERFIRFLSQNSIGWAAAGQVPARKSVRNTAEFRSMPVQYAFSQQIPNIHYLPRTTVMFEMNLELDLAVEKVIRGRATPLEALQVANKNLQDDLEKDAMERGSS